MKNSLLIRHNRTLALLLLLCFVSASAIAQVPSDPQNIIPPDPLQEEYPCYISIVGDFESTCILPMGKEWYYEEQDAVIACQGMTITYTAYADMGGNAPESWLWEVAGAVSYSDHSNGSITVTWGEGTTGQLTVTVYGPGGISCTKTVNVRLIEKPHINVVTTPAYTEVPGGPKVIYVCKGETVEFTELSSTTNTDIVGYYWESMMGGTSSTPNYRIENVWTNDQVIHRVYNNCGCYDEEIYEIQVLTGDILELGCYGTVCEGAKVTYTANSPACNQFFWYVEGGTIVDGQNTPQVTVQWDNPQNGYGVIAIDGNLCGNNACPAMLSKKIPIIENNLSIKGQTTACEGEAVIYSIPLFGSTEYHWSITPNTGVTQMAVNGANEQMYIFNQAGIYQISVSYKCDFLECGEFTSEPLTVVVKPKLSISGEDRICITNLCNLSTSPTISATWKIYDMDNNNQFVSSYSSLSNLSVSFPHPGKYLITAENNNFCRVAEFILNVQDAPPAPTLSDLDPSNPHTACPNSGILLKANPSNPDYTIIWKPVCNSGSPDSVSGNEVTINYGNTVCNVEAYTYDRMLGCRSSSAYIHTVTERLPLPINISSPITVCPGTKIVWNDNDVPNQEGFLYKWKIQETMQHCASIQGDAFSNAVTLAVNNHTSGNYPVNFFVSLERRYCDTTIYDTIHIIVRGQDSVSVAITQNHDTVCPGTNVTFTGHGGSVTAYKWKTDEGTQVYTGATFTHAFATSGNHTVTLMYSVLDYCTNTQYYTSKTTHVYVLQAPVSNGLYLNSSTNYVGVHVPVPNNYSFAWYYGGNLLPNTTGDTAGFRGFGCYTCIITDNTTGCTKTVTKCFDEPVPPCNQVGWDDISYDPCTATLHLETQVTGSPVYWSVAGGDYSIAYLNSTHSEVDITFEDAHYYYITAYSSGNNCEISNTSYDVTFIPVFTFEKKCNEIVIHNKSKYRNGNTQIAMTVNGVPCISFPAHNASYTYPISTNGSYTFQLTQPHNCPLATVVFNTVNNDELIITASNGSNPVRTCDNTPLVLTANLSSGAPISSTLWSFSDGTYFKENGNTFYHTYETSLSQYYVTAEVLDQNGCPISGSVSMYSYTNSIETGSLSSPGNPVCPYVSSRTLTFTSDNSDFDENTASYQWNIGYYPNQYSRPTSFTANYTVLVTDNNFCKEHAQKEVIFKTRPTAIIVADMYKCCIGDKVKLYGAPGPDSNDYIFAWDIKDPNGNHTTPSTATVTLSASVVGTYEINLNVTNNQGCDADASTVYITVYSTPSAPSIGFGSRLCIDDPPVELVGSSAVTTDLHWSNGSTGTTAYYFTPGVATLWYYDPISGCKSSEAHISIDAQPNFDAMLTGCYEKCPEYFRNNPQLPVWGLTTWMQDIDWKWYLDGSSIDAGSGNYTYNPLMLPLVWFGKYNLDVDYNNNNCHVSSPLLTITEKEVCDCENVDITTKTSWYVKDCRLYYDINVTVCNNSDLVDCFKDLKPLFESEYMNVVWTDFGGATLAPGDCFSFNILLEVSQFVPSQTAVFQLFDDCNNCTTEFSISLMPDKIDCEEEMNLDWYEVNPELSSNVAAYFDFKLNVSPCQNLIAFWTEPPMVINYWYDGAAMVQGLGMVDFATLTQLMAEGGKICFYAITCEGDKLCKRRVCISAEEVYNILHDMGLAKTNTSGGSKGGNTKRMPNPDLGNDTDPRLMPNPTTGEVNVIGTTDEVVEVLVMDMNGRQMATFDNTSNFNISTLPSGIYIVRVKTHLDNTDKVTYLKLVKK